jgi:hypothetical protein
MQSKSHLSHFQHTRLISIGYRKQNDGENFHHCDRENDPFKLELSWLIGGDLLKAYESR